MLGMMRYLAPVLQFLTGVLLTDKAMPPSRLAGFALVWAALVLLTMEGLRNRHRVRQEAVNQVEGVGSLA
jgi:chloramphenicol-sensitive protein RarD